MPKVTAIEPQKKHIERVNVFVDDRFAFGLDGKLLVDFDLYKGKELTEQEIEKIKSGDSLSKCLEKAYRFLSFRPRSEKEIREKLLEKFDEKTVEEAIKKLKEYNLINDLEFSRMWVNSRSGGRSARALGFELKKKGIEKSVIESAVESVTKEVELENALRLVESKSKYRGLEKNEAYKKIGGFLARRGYSYEIIKKVLEKIN